MLTLMLMLMPIPSPTLIPEADSDMLVDAGRSAADCAAARGSDAAPMRRYVLLDPTPSQSVGAGQATYVSADCRNLQARGGMFDKCAGLETVHCGIFARRDPALNNAAQCNGAPPDCFNATPPAAVSLVRYFPRFFHSSTFHVALAATVRVLKRWRAWHWGPSQCCLHLFIL